ncbi:M1 family aminopeptidase [Flavicella sediminum]|uniref:M1 family aminopeptidase n=1 Tax=Flavicella sediminum TaxID=2585141 RepID=UPI0011241777|nr:M1 family aminopeptidase [Flavicella sediminum]
MKFKSLLRLLLLSTVVSFAQIPSKQLKYKNAQVYNKTFNLQHTKLDVGFNFSEELLYGKAWLDVTPHFYATDKLELDAKGMLINEISIAGKKLEYHYDGMKIYIDLDKTYKKTDTLHLYIDYTARPNRVKQEGSNAITSAKGLYFINPNGDSVDKPTQIWTQGETEASSCWFPTIDKPNQKTTQEIYITVPDKYKTLSNGMLISSDVKKEGFRTDYWKMDQKHAPYLFFMGVGEFAVVKDKWKGKEVNYYVEKEYEHLAKKIFGNTPRMLDYFSEITGIDYVWDKYSQIVVRDFVSGAMENTTAVVHGEGAYQSEGDLLDQNTWENIIAHELFHHWFGDLVTTENWGNLTLNESFANYSEYLWVAHAYGKDRADAHMQKEIEGYKKGDNLGKHLVRFDYVNKEDMFDAVSYNKGGVVLHMLRNYIGDAAFFQGIKKYLTDFQFKAAEAHNLRMAFEEVSGKDLNWFFDQWYYGSGHPDVSISHDYNILEKTVTITLKQSEDAVFYFPVNIVIYEKGKKTSRDLFVDASEKSFVYSYEKYPDWIHVNADHVVLGEFRQHKALKEYKFQLQNAPHYLDRMTALKELIKHQEDKDVFELVVKAFDDSYYEVQVVALEGIDLSNKHAKRDVIGKIERLVKTAKNNFVKAAAIKVLGRLVYFDYQAGFEKACESESNLVKTSALEALYYLDKPLAMKKAKSLPKSVKKAIAFPLSKMYFKNRDVEEMSFVAGSVIQGMHLNNDKEINELFAKAFQWIAASNNVQAYRNLVADMVVKGKQYKKYNFDKKMISMLREMVYKQEKSNNSNAKELVAVVKSGLVQLVE